MYLLYILIGNFGNEFWCTINDNWGVLNYYIIIRKVVSVIEKMVGRNILSQLAWNNYYNYTNPKNTLYFAEIVQVYIENLKELFFILKVIFITNKSRLENKDLKIYLVAMSITSLWQLVF